MNGAQSPNVCQTMEKIKPHIMKAAQRMLERFGGGALDQVELRVLELQQHDEKKALALWKEIREAVKKLCQDEPGRTTH
jgi:hypothetical protein